MMVSEESATASLSSARGEIARFARASAIVLLGSFLLLIISLTFTRITNNDIWWQMKTGELILQEKTFPRVDPYSCVAQGRRWINHEWLSEVIFHLVDRCCSVKGLIILKMILVLCISLVLLFHARIGSPRLIWTVPILSLALYTATASLYIRPHLFTYLLLPLVLYILEKRKSSGCHGVPLVFIPLMLVWANLHGGFIIGLAVVTLYVAGDFIKYGLKKRPWNAFSTGVLRKSAAVTGILYLVSLLNPSGYHAFLYLYELWKSKVFLRTILEWQPTFTSAFRDTYTFRYYCTYLAIALFSLFLARKRLHWGMLFVFFFLFYLSVSMNRNVGTFAVGTAGMVAANFNMTLQNKRKGYPSCLISLLISLVLLFLSFQNFTRGFAVSPGLHRQPGIGINLGKRGTEGAAFLRRNHVTGNVLNAYAFGGDLIYHCFPACRPAMDSRNEVYGRDLFLEYSAALAGPKRFERYAEKYNLDIAFLQYPKPQKDHPLHQYLHDMPGWRLVYFDDAGLIYLRSKPAFHGIIQSLGYEWLNPVLFNPGLMDRKDIPGYFTEVRRAVKAAPYSQVARTMLVNLYTLTGEYEKAGEENARILALDRYSYRYYINEGLILWMQGEGEAAGPLFRRALELHPTSVSARNYLEMTENGS